MFWIAWDPDDAFTHLTLDVGFRAGTEPALWTRASAQVQGPIRTLCAYRRRPLFAASLTECGDRVVSCPKCLRDMQAEVDRLRKVLPGGLL